MPVGVNRKDALDYMRSLRAIEDSVRFINREDAQQVAKAGVTFLKGIFPKSDDSNPRYFAPGAHEPSVRMPHLYTGWRTYQTATVDGSGFLIQHVRAKDPLVRKVLMALDQGARSVEVVLRKAKAFRFMGAGRIVFAKGTLDIPARKPQPGPEGYIKPTSDFIRDSIESLARQRAADIEEIVRAKGQKKLSRLELLKQRAAYLKAGKILDQ